VIALGDDSAIALSGDNISFSTIAIRTPAW
jgi:hypothetical protein